MGWTYSRQPQAAPLPEQVVGLLDDPASVFSTGSRRLDVAALQRVDRLRERPVADRLGAGEEASSASSE